MRTAVGCCYLCLDAVRQNPLTKTARNADIEVVVKDWLRTSTSRSGGTALNGCSDADGSQKCAKRQRPIMQDSDIEGSSDD